MKKKTGVHYYINVKNLEEIIKEEENKDEDLKRTLHMLQTYFVGLTKLVKDRGGKIEKYTSGRAHIVFEISENENIDNNIVETMCACFIYVNSIFNKLGKYSRYKNFIVHAGVDYGDYYDYEIENDKITSIGSVANNSAKIQSAALKNHIYATKSFINNIDSEIKDKFDRLDNDEYEELYNKLNINDIYYINYLDIFNGDKNNEILESLDEVKNKVEEETKEINLKDIIFEDVVKKVSFDNLSLKGVNKKIERAAIICADIRGFTKLFTVSNSNLEELKEVMVEIYTAMGEVVESFNGTLVQYQGDRLVAIYHDYDTEKDYIIRAIEATLTLKERLVEISKNDEIKKKLKNKEISVGIGCSTGKVIATRLGMNKNKDNIVLGEAYKYSNKAEDEYADKGEVVISKILKNEIDLISEDELNENTKYEVLSELFKAINTTGYYLTNVTFEEYNIKLQKAEEEKNIINQVAEQEFKSIGGVRPFGR